MFRLNFCAEAFFLHFQLSVLESLIVKSLLRLIVKRILKSHTFSQMELRENPRVRF